MHGTAKKIISLALSLALILGLVIVPTVSAADYRDLSLTTVQVGSTLYGGFFESDDTVTDPVGSSAYCRGYSIYVKAGDSIFIRVTGSEAKPYIYVTETDGSAVLASGHCDDGGVLFTSEKDGAYPIILSSSLPGEYRMSIEWVGIPAIGNYTYLNYQPVEPPFSTTVTLSGENTFDIAVNGFSGMGYKLNLIENQTITVGVRSVTALPPSAQLQYYLLDGITGDIAGDVVGNYFGGINDMRIKKSGTYYLLILTNSIVEITANINIETTMPDNIIPASEMSFTDIDGDYFGMDALDDSSQLIIDHLGNTVFADGYRVRLNKGDTLRVEMTAYDFRPNTYLCGDDISADPIEFGINSATRSTAVYTASEDGYCHIYAESFDSLLSGRYSIKVTVTPAEEPTSQSATEPPTEPTTQTPTEPTTQTPTEPTTQSPTEPTTQSPTEPTTQSPTEPTTQTPTEPTTQTPTQPTTESPTQPTTQSPTEPTTEPPTEPTTQSPTEPTTQSPTEPTTEPTTQSPTEPTTQTPTQPTTQTPTQPTTQSPTEPTTQSPTEPTTQSPTEPTTQSPTEPTTEPPTQPDIEPSENCDLIISAVKLIGDKLMVVVNNIGSGDSGECPVTVSLNGDVLGQADVAGLPSGKSIIVLIELDSVPQNGVVVVTVNDTGASPESCASDNYKLLRI